MRLVLSFRAPPEWPHSAHFEQHTTIDVTGHEASATGELEKALRQWSGDARLALCLHHEASAPINPVRAAPISEADGHTPASQSQARILPDTGVAIVLTHQGTLVLTAYENEDEDEPRWTRSLPFVLEPERFPRVAFDKTTWSQASETHVTAGIPPAELQPSGWEFVCAPLLKVLLGDGVAVCLALQPVVGRTSQRPLRMYGDRLYGVTAIQIVAHATLFDKDGDSTNEKVATTKRTCACCLADGAMFVCAGCKTDGASSLRYCSRACQKAHRPIHARFCDRSTTPVIRWSDVPRLCEACGSSAATGCGACRMAFCSSRCYTSHALVHRPLCCTIGLSLDKKTCPQDNLMVIRPDAQPRFLTRNIVAGSSTTDVRPVVRDILRAGAELVFASDLAATLAR
jgi:hypothetical protein